MCLIRKYTIAAPRWPDLSQINRRVGKGGVPFPAALKGEDTAMNALGRTISTVGLCAVALWGRPGRADEIPGAMPGDDAMTCEQIGAELAPYAQQMTPAATALGQTGQELIARGERRVAEATPALVALTAAATAASADPTGLSTKPLIAAHEAMQQREWNRSIAEDKPLVDQMNAQTNAVVEQAAPLQANPRIQRLMQLAQDKNCH